VGLLAGATLASTAWAQSVVLPATKLAPLAGAYYTPALGQASIGFHGTDLGWTFKHGNELRVLFGDSWADSNGTAIGPIGDDAQGVIDLTAFPRGNSVDAYVAAHPPLPGDFPWHAAGPPLTFRLNAFLKVAPMPVYDGGCCTNLLKMGLGRTPLTGFSNGSTGAFALFAREVVIPCNSTCSVTGSGCATDLGICAGTTGEDSVPCALGTTCSNGAACNAVPGAGGGVCFDPTSSMNDGSAAGHLLSVIYNNRVGNADPIIEEQYYTQVWATNKFMNVVSRTVENFDPNRGTAQQNQNVYTPADGANPSIEKVFLWGRPDFVGSLQQHRDAELYFAYVDLPSYSATGSFAWVPHYWTGVDGTGKPLFDTNPANAKPLNLSAPAPNAATAEVYDVVDQMAVSYIPNMNKWVMLYGGDIHPNIMSLFAGPNTGFVVSDPDHAIHARFSSTPWGPWSAPVQVYKPGDPATLPAGSEYARLGSIHHNLCPFTGSPCVTGETALAYAITNYGFLYGPNIIDVWTEPRGTGNLDADIYWNVSTWDPYQVMLMRTRINH
jgi:hypothetical protein